MSESSARKTRLIVRTPVGVIVDRQVRGLTAEDGSGRFGVRPGCEPLLAALVPGLLTYRDEQGAESILVVGHGVLEAQRSEVRVAVREAIVCHSLAIVCDEVQRNVRIRREGEAAMHELFGKMYQKLLKGLVDEERLA
jgi:F-type H+-transporting ATPase subunit epsilon